MPACTAEARRIGRGYAEAAELTAEDIFCGDPRVERVFADALLDLVQHRPEHYNVPLQCFRAGPVALFAVPMGLANGCLGYIPLRECFARGGYEVKPGPALLCRGAADMLLAALREMASEFF